MVNSSVRWPRGSSNMLSADQTHHIYPPVNSNSCAATTHPPPFNIHKHSHSYPLSELRADSEKPPLPWGTEKSRGRTQQMLKGISNHWNQGGLLVNNEYKLKYGVSARSCGKWEKWADAQLLTWWGDCRVCSCTLKMGQRRCLSVFFFPLASVL